MVDRINNQNQGKTRPKLSLSSKLKNADAVPVDELIAALAAARENRRARQVNEWERMYHTRRIAT
jgi:hypothetical protein